MCQSFPNCIENSDIVVCLWQICFLSSQIGWTRFPDTSCQLSFSLNRCVWNQIFCIIKLLCYWKCVQSVSCILRSLKFFHEKHMEKQISSVLYHKCFNNSLKHLCKTGDRYWIKILKIIFVCFVVHNNARYLDSSSVI